MSTKITSLNIEILDHSLHGKYNTNYTNENGDSGFDILMGKATIVKEKSISQKINLGIKVAMYEVDQETGNSESIGFMLLPRSSTGSKTGLRLSNSVGIIDKQYRGELIACVDNHGNTEMISAGSRLFQIVPFHGRGVDKVVIVDRVDETSRGEGGFGSTGR